MGAGCAELNSGCNARCRSFEMYESCISRDPDEGRGGGRGKGEGARTRGREGREGWIADERGWCRSDVVAGRASASTELDLSSVVANLEREREREGERGRREEGGRERKREAGEDAVGEEDR